MYLRLAVFEEGASFLKICFMHMSTLPVCICMYVNHVHAWCPQRLEGTTWVLWMDLGSLQEQ